MFPGIDGFHWSFGHVLFLTIFFVVLVTIASTVLAAILRSRRDLGKVESLRWRAEFEELPETDRCCRHQLAGRVAHRVCPHAFECGRCPDYVRFAALPAQASEETFGLDYPAGRLYHRGHTWVEPQDDGTVTVGLDDLSMHLLGRPESVDLPAAGTYLKCNGTAWSMKKKGFEVRILCPVEGVVVECGDPQRGWYLRLQPAHSIACQRHLLFGAEVSGWLRRELERLQIQLAPGDRSPALADGGVLVSGLMDSLPGVRWDKVLADTFLES